MTGGSNPSLLALSRAEHEVAKRWLVRSRLAHSATLVLTTLTVWASGPWHYYFALGALGTEAFAWGCRVYGAVGRHALAEKGRRAALLWNAFGKTPGPLDLRDLRAEFSEQAEQTATSFEDDDYYASTQAQGPDRLRDLIQESAFWSHQLYRTAAMTMGALAAVLLILVLVAFAIVMGAQSADYALTVARIGVVFLSFLVFSDVLTDAWAWSVAATKSKEVSRRLDGETLNDPPNALAVFGDYSIATATAPPIPSFVYRRHHDRIERAWYATQ